MHEVFTEKESRLNAALDKVQNKLKYFSENQEQLPESVLEQWNNWHDLKDRLINRIWDNWQAFKEWHWTQHGFNAY